MRESRVPPEEGQAHLKAADSSQESLDYSKDFLDRLWERLIALMGVSFTIGLFSSALLEAGREHQFLRQGVDVSESGPSLKPLAGLIAHLDPATLDRGMLAYADSLMALLEDLTGDLLVCRVEPLVREFKSRIEED